jgi:hypothetical protein
MSEADPGGEGRGDWLGCPAGPAAEVDADVEVKVFGEEVLEFAAFDDPQPVVAGGEGLGFCADPGCGKRSRNNYFP